MKRLYDLFEAKGSVPARIDARLHSIEAPLVEYRLIGCGKYPYDCQHKKDYPDAYIYLNESCGWAGSYQLDLQEDGSYIIK